MATPKTPEWEVVLKKSKSTPQRTLKKGQSKKILKGHEIAQKRLQEQLFPKGSSIVSPTGAGIAFQERRRPEKSQRTRDFSNRSPKILPPLVVVTPEIRKAKKKKSLKAAADSIQKDALQAAMLDWEKYPSFEVQFQRLAEHFEKIFTGCSLGPQRDQQTKTFERRLQIPAVYIGKDIYKLVRKYLFSRRVPEEALEGFFWFLLSTLISIEAKTSSALAELSGIGLRILLQILLRDAKFDLFERNKKKIEEEIYRKNKLPTGALALVVWLGGQLLFSHPTRALAVWLTHCLPPLTNAATTSPTSKRGVALGYSIDFLLAFTNGPVRLGPVTPALEPVLLHGLDRLLLARAGESSSPALVQLIPASLALLVRLLGPPGFSRLLSYAASNRPLLRQHALQQSLEAIRTHPDFLDTWHLVHAHQVAQSNNLLFFLSEHLPELSPQPLPPQQLSAFILKILKINKALLLGKYTAPDSKTPPQLSPEDLVDINMCTVTAKALLKKLAQRSWGRTALTVALPCLFLSGVAAFYNCCVEQFYETTLCNDVSFLCPNT